MSVSRTAYSAADAPLSSLKNLAAIFVMSFALCWVAITGMAAAMNQTGGTGNCVKFYRCINNLADTKGCPVLVIFGGHSDLAYTRSNFPHRDVLSVWSRLFMNNPHNVVGHWAP
jgi:hypothetical protein